jgi:uncharacterized membrane protein
MSDYNEKLAQLQLRLDKMVDYQGYFNKEIALLKTEIFQLKKVNPDIRTIQQPQPNQQVTHQQKKDTSKSEPQIFVEEVKQTQILQNYQTTDSFSQNYNIEEFVGKNLISIIGILITILGVGIGAKYAIDNNLISPTTRLVIGYVFAFGLLGFSLKLKENYEKFSSVLLSGAMAIMFFLTFFAHSFYDLISQPFAFLLMVSITAFTVFSALNYNRQIIAIIGLVGAYAIPFLLSDCSGRVVILFGYVAIINLGILAVSIHKYWNILFVTAFGFTWLIFIAWFANKFEVDEHFTIALFFSTLFFAIFYVSFIAYKLTKNREFSLLNAALLLANSIIYFVLGCAILWQNNETRNFLGLFTLANGIVHFGFGFLINRKLGSQKTIYFALSLALLFTAISVPMQMEHLWTIVFWTLAFVWLFAIGNLKRIDFYEIASYILMGFTAVAFIIYISENQVNWSQYYNSPTITSILTLSPISNIPFLIGSIFVVGFGIICYLINNKKGESALDLDIFRFLKISVSSIFLLALYNLFRTEITNYWHLQYVKTAVLDSVNYSNSGENRLGFDKNLQLFNIIWQINYTMLFLSILSFVNIKWLKNVGFGFVSLILNAFVLSIFATIGLYLISDLRESYLSQYYAGNFVRGSSFIIIRYISLAFVAVLVVASYIEYKQEFIKKAADISTIFEMVFKAILLIILSSELLNLTDIFGYKDSYKLALSLLWGVYSLILIALGILWRKSHLRIGAIVLFAITLAKLFLYDIASLSTISKTIVFVSLGLMLLIISFLYNKYKSLIFD